jgi:DNA-binding response OmpR family regulator
MLGTTILIVEDEALIALDLERIIEASGARPIGVSTLAQAATLSGHWPELSLAIFNPPRGAAEEAVVRNLALAGIALIVSTADRTYDPARSGLSSAVMLVKPFTEDEVVAACAAALASRSA